MANILAIVTNLIVAVNSPEMIRFSRRLTSEALQMVTKWLRMPENFLRMLANFLRSLRLLNNQFAEFVVNPLRMHANALRMKRLHNACAAKPLANVSLFHFYSPGYID